MLDRIKVALQITSNTFDAELTQMIDEAKNDMGFADITNEDTADASVAQCIILYCAYRFELFHGSETKAMTYKNIYDEQKATLGMAEGYTNYDENL